VVIVAAIAAARASWGAAPSTKPAGLVVVARGADCGEDT
jgi:hypothetical protein